LAGAGDRRRLAIAGRFPDDGRVILSLDIGTSSARARIHDERGVPLPGHTHQEPYEPATTADGGVEHDADRLLRAVVACLDRALTPARPPAILGVGVTSFWHGLLGFDAAGRPATPILTWADTRAARDADLLRHALDDDRIHARTGCHLHASYWPAKLRWLAHDRPAIARRVARWGSIGEHLEQTFFGEAATSISMASGTGLFDQRALAWDAETLAAAGIEERQLFPLRDRDEGRRGLRPPWARRWPALARATWFPALGDGACSTVGSDCLDASRIALNVGTSAAMRFVAGGALAPPPGLWSYRVDRQRTLVGGATSEGGNVHAWLRSVLRLPDDAEVEAAVARAEPDTHGLTMLPFVAGERSPGWRSDRRATISGLSLETTALAILRAGLEAVALRLAAVYALLAPLAAPRHTVIASGGALRSRAWAQMIADALGRPLQLSSEEEATSRGCALLALQSLGLLPDLGAAQAPPGPVVEPSPRRHALYRAALERQRRLDARV
jgi:gluconokinase